VLMEEMIPLVYDELRRIAASKLRAERPSHTLSATALVHEAWLEVSRLDRIAWHSRTHYLAVTVRAMRRILVDYAVARKRQKRGGGEAPLHLEGDTWAIAESRADEFLAIDQALARLAELNERQARIVEYRVFGGMTVEESAKTLNVSQATIKREWATARAWLNRELQE